MDNTKITFTVSNTNPDAKLGFETRLDNQIVFDTDHVPDSVEISVPVADDNAEHVLTLVLKNKTGEHTRLTSTGEIESDALLEIKDMAFDGIKLGQIFNEQTVYAHDVNGTDILSDHQFFGTMGCNGTVTLTFTTPIYVWLLEHM
jgi:hypothetical protein